MVGGAGRIDRECSDGLLDDMAQELEGEVSSRWCASMDYGSWLFKSLDLMRDVGVEPGTGLDNGWVCTRCM